MKRLKEEEYISRQRGDILEYAWCYRETEKDQYGWNRVKDNEMISDKKRKGK